MGLPFSRDQFLDVFADYNEAFWPLAVVLWLLTAVALGSLGRDTRGARRSISALLAVQWLWAGVAYHAAFFAAINPAAPWFAGLFVIEAGLLAWYGVARDGLSFASGSWLHRVASRTLVGYALIYPAVAWAEGNAYPWSPTFGVPCPTTILTIGFLLAGGAPVPVAVALIPILWAFVGGSAAFLLGMRADLVLLAAGIALTASVIRRHDIRLWYRSGSSRSCLSAPVRRG